MIDMKRLEKEIEDLAILMSKIGMAILYEKGETKRDLQSAMEQIRAARGILLKVQERPTTRTIERRARA